MVKIWILQSLAFDLAFPTFVSLLQFIWNPWHLKRPVVGKNVKSEHYNPENNYHLRLDILVHCDISGAPLEFSFDGFQNFVLLQKTMKNAYIMFLFEYWWVCILP